MTLLYRLIQWVLKIASKFLPWREPKCLEGEHSLVLLREHLENMSYQNYMIVTDQGMVKFGLLKHLKESLHSPKYQLHVYDETIPNPTIQNIDDAYQIYLNNHCEAIIGFGGGSAMDAAKGLAIRVRYPKKPIKKFKGILKIHKKLPYLMMIPTTAGTGSETTLAAVISDPKTHEKYAIMDMHLMPKIAVLDPYLLQNLPSFFTATTGMDALTHAIEAYLSLGATKKTRLKSISAIQVIFETLEASYHHPKDLSLRLKMLKASYDAGYAFTRAYVGNIHAIAHTFGGFYQIPHGYANAIIMPYVLSYSLPKIEKKLAMIADLTHLCENSDTITDKAKKVISKIESMNQAMSIPNQIEIEHDLHLEEMIHRALIEANPLYPVPHIYSKKDFKTIYNQVIAIQSKSS